MNASEIIKSIEAEQLKAEVPEFRVGDTVKVYGKIKEGNRERIQVFEGVVIKRQGLLCALCVWYFPLEAPECRELELSQQYLCSAQ